MKLQFIQHSTFLRVLALAALLTFGGSPVAFAGVEGTVGSYKVELTTDPVVIPVGKANLVLRITNRAGKLVDGASVRVITGMPGMNMGEKEVPAVPKPGNPGVYTAPASFPMAGGYESKLTISGPQGVATGVIKTQTGQNTATAEGGSFSLRGLLPWLLGLLAVAFVLYRMRKSGQRVNWRGVFNRQVLGGLLLLAVMLAGAVWAVNTQRRPGSMTPIEAQAMEMNTPAPPGVLPVELALVKRGAVASTVRYSGQAVGYTEQDVYPRVRGVITDLSVYPGDRVRRGQLLARLDLSEIAPQVAERQAAAAQATQGVGVARAEAEQAQEAVGQALAELSGRQGAVAEARASLTAAREERTNAQADLSAMQTQVADAEAGLEAARADQAYWQQQIARTQALLKAGAVSGEEFQREQAQAQTADAKVRQAQAKISQVAAQVRAARSAVRKTDALIRSADAKVGQAQSELMAHHAHVRQTRAAASTARQRIAQAQSGVTQARAAAQAATTTRGFSEIRSRIDGVVTQRVISPGVLVNPGQAILRVAQISPIRLQANVAESDLARIRVGSPVTVRDRDGTVKPMRARVTSVSPAVDPQARTGVVEAVVPNGNERFLPGAFVVMEITTGRAEDTLQVPTRAVQRRGAPSGSGVLSTEEAASVWVAEPAGSEGQFTSRQVPVQTGTSNGNMIAIRSGLEEGQQVIVSGYQSLRSGDTVAAAGSAAAAATAASAPTGNGGMAGMAGMPGMAGGEGKATTSSNSAGGGTPGLTSGSDSAGPGQPVQTASIAVTEQGFQPASLSLKAGEPARVTFTRKTDATCATEVLFPAYNIKKPLPLNQPVAVEFTPKAAGDITFTCGMNMFKGKVVAR